MRPKGEATGCSRITKGTSAFWDALQCARRVKLQDIAESPKAQYQSSCLDGLAYCFDFFVILSMKLSFTLSAVSALTGLMTLLWLKNLPSSTGLMLLSLTASLALWLAGRSTGPWTKWVGMLSIALLAVCYGCWRAHQALSTRLPLAGEGSYQLLATIRNLPSHSTDLSQAEFIVHSCHPLQLSVPTPCPKRVRLSWYHPLSVWHTGETWQLIAKLKPPRSLYNPGSFDQEAWFLVHGIDAIGYLRQADQAQRIQTSPWWQRLDQSVRDTLNQRILSGCQQQEGCAQVQALTLGQRDRFSQADWRLLQQTGTNHLFAIAGLHIGFVASACFYLTKHLWRHLGRWPLWLTAPTAGAISALVSAVSYSALAGFALPTQRACLSLSLLMVARLNQRRLPPWQTWWCALMVILLWQPLWLLDSSLWLSFGTVALLIYGLAYRWPKTSHHWRDFLALQLVLTIGLWPLTVFYFQNISLTTFLANLCTIPWVGFTILPLCLIAAVISFFSPTVAAWLWQLAAWQLALLKHLLHFFSTIAYSQWPITFTHPSLVLLGVWGVLLLLAPKAVPGKWLGLCYCWAAVAWPKPHPPANSVWLKLLDVGQGLSVLVQTQHHALVFDTGNRFSDQADMGLNVVLPALKTAGITRLDTLVISHGDSDHAGGAASVTDHLRVDSFYSSDVGKLTALVPTVVWQNCIAGQQWQWDGVSFTFLYPQLDSPFPYGNNRCCVLRIATATQAILLTGDIEKPVEAYLLSHDHQALASTLLIAPHHGSKTSSTTAFLQAVHPTWVLFAVGYHNRFHLPNGRVVKRYQDLPAACYDTARDGQIQVFFNDQQPPQIIATRQRDTQFWRFT